MPSALSKALENEYGAGTEGPPSPMGHSSGLEGMPGRGPARRDGGSGTDAYFERSTIPTYWVDLEQESFLNSGSLSSPMGPSSSSGPAGVRRVAAAGRGGMPSRKPTQRILRANLRNLTYAAQYLLLEDFFLQGFLMRKHHRPFAGSPELTSSQPTTQSQSSTTPASQALGNEPIPNGKEREGRDQRISKLKPKKILGSVFITATPVPPSAGRDPLWARAWISPMVSLFPWGSGSSIFVVAEDRSPPYLFEGGLMSRTGRDRPISNPKEENRESITLDQRVREQHTPMSRGEGGQLKQSSRKCIIRKSQQRVCLGIELQMNK